MLAFEYKIANSMVFQEKHFNLNRQSNPEPLVLEISLTPLRVL